MEMTTTTSPLATGRTCRHIGMPAERLATPPARTWRPEAFHLILTAQVAAGVLGSLFL